MHRFWWPTSKGPASPLCRAFLRPWHRSSALPPAYLSAYRSLGPCLEDRTTIAFAGLIEREFGGLVPPPGWLRQSRCFLSYRTWAKMEQNGTKVHTSAREKSRRSPGFFHGPFRALSNRSEALLHQALSELRRSEPAALSNLVSNVPAVLRWAHRGRGDLRRTTSRRARPERC